MQILHTEQLNSFSILYQFTSIGFATRWAETIETQLIMFKIVCLSDNIDFEFFDKI